MSAFIIKKRLFVHASGRWEGDRIFQIRETDGSFEIVIEVNTTGVGDKVWSTPNYGFNTAEEAETWLRDVYLPNNIANIDLIEEV